MLTSGLQLLAGLGQTKKKRFYPYQVSTTFFIL